MNNTKIVVQCPLAGCLVPDEVCQACEYRTSGFRCPESKRIAPLALCEKCLTADPNRPCLMSRVAEGKMTLAELPVSEVSVMCGCPRVLAFGTVADDVLGVVELFRKEPTHE